jgi:hypothetical protein
MPRSARSRSRSRHRRKRSRTRSPPSTKKQSSSRKKSVNDENEFLEEVKKRDVREREALLRHLDDRERGTRTIMLTIGPMVNERQVYEIFSGNIGKEESPRRLLRCQVV